MKIIIVGLGKVGQSLALELGNEDNEITVIDCREEIVQEITSQNDFMGVVGNGSTYSIQMEAGIESADLMIAVTGSDELNLLCCLIAKKAGNCHTIARVRNPEYSTELDFIKEELGLAMVINPELAAAGEVAQALQFPSAIEVNSFVRNRVRLLKFRVPERSALANMRIADLPSKLRSHVLICAVERGEEVIIPNGNTMLYARDVVSVIGKASDANEFFRQAGIVTNQVKNLMIVGGSPIAYYLAKIMINSGVRVKIVEKSMKRCEELSDLLPKATIVYGDGTDKDLLLEEGIDRYESFAALTNIDEENILLSLYARKTGEKKLITKINRIAFDEVIRELDLDTVVYPKNITAEHIIRYVRSMKNSLGSNVETLHKILGGKAEALEFVIRGNSRVTGVALHELAIKDGVLIAGIARDGKVLIPRGSDKIMQGDSVIVITRYRGLNDVEDILAK
ncbi:Trk system potassium transporter TrkA [Parablautia sp. Marseille-Q6255]|uniref:Trk system potassium transporter TrkA n=1 Tax=Parablautia sp. Marseille-Q6255 TaxID=3039593 RepID=UPI0024BCB13C|nr:Trk system potassium transporter TrkA [Parablautia sp. Marseille-Q6255]